VESDLSQYSNTTSGFITNSVATLSSLTSIGTIGTGAWEGTAIGDTYISSSTDYLADSDTTYSAGTGMSLDGTTFNWSSSGMTWAGNKIADAYISSSTEYLVDTNTDIYWTGTSDNLVAATGRTSLELGSIATYLSFLVLRNSSAK